MYMYVYYIYIYIYDNQDNQVEGELIKTKKTVK